MKTRNLCPVPVKQGTLRHLINRFEEGKIWYEPNAGHDLGPDDIANSMFTMATICRRRKKSKGRRAFLDLGCGCGRIAAALSHRFPDAAIDIMDSNPNYLQHAKK